MKIEHRRGFAATQLRVVAAGVFAVAGLGWAGWTVFGTHGGEARAKPASKEHVEKSTVVDKDGRPTDAVYEKTRGGAAKEVTSRLASMASEAAASVPSFGTQGNGAAAELGPSIELAVGGLLSGDHEAFLAAMRALGGVVPGTLDGEHPLFAALKDKLAGAQVDLTRLEVRRHEQRRPGPRVQQRERQEGDPAGNVNVNEQTREMRPGGLFEDATGRVDDKAIDVRFPFRAKGAADEEWFGLVLVWNDSVKKWQPGAFQLTKREVTITGGEG